MYSLSRLHQPHHLPPATGPICPVCDGPLPQEKHIGWNTHMGLVWNKRGVVQITPQEMLVVDLMLRRQTPVLPESFFQRLYGAETGELQTSTNVVKVMISHLRRKLRPIGLTVKLMGYKRGYMIKDA